MTKLGRLALLLVLAGVLSACRDDAEKAAELVMRGIARPVSERAEAQKDLREAIAIDPENADALRALATLEIAEGKFGAAKQMLARLLAGKPADPDLNLALADIALYEQDIPAASTYLGAAAPSAPDDPRLRATRTALDYYAAVAAGNAQVRAARAGDAAAMLGADPVLMPALRVVVQDQLARGDPRPALPLIDAARARRPGDFEIEMMRLGALTKSGDDAAAIEQMKAMYKTFPGDADLRSWLTDWYVTEAPTREAIDFLAELARGQAEDDAAQQTLFAYVEKALQPEGAVAELDRLAGLVPPGAVADLYRAEAARLRYGLGDTRSAIATLREVTKAGAPLSGRVDLRTELAGMLAATGGQTEAMAIVDKVLATSPYSLPALKMRARWQIDMNDANAAVSTLRAALSNNSADPALLGLIAEAYEKTGDTELAGRALSDAMAATKGGVAETVAVVRFLERTGKRATAIATLRTARRTYPDDPAIAALAGELGVPSP